MMKRFIPLLFVLLLALVLAFVLDDFVRQMIVAPFLFMLWITWRLLQSLPQIVFWILFVVVALLILVRSFNREFNRPHRRRTPENYFPVGAVASWQHQLQQAEKQTNFRRPLAYSLAQLCQKTLSQKDPLNHNESQSLPKFIATLPPEIAAQIQAEILRKPVVSSRWYRMQPSQQQETLRLDPEIIVEFLEKETALE